MIKNPLYYCNDRGFKDKDKNSECLSQDLTTAIYILTINNLFVGLQIW